MNYNNIESFRKNGFEGFIKISDLRQKKIKLPDSQGAYLILAPEDFKPKFIQIGTAGFFKDRDPNVSIEVLKDKWVSDTRVLFIGASNNIKRRVMQFLYFGEGKHIGHWGGRYIWQLDNSDDLILCWKKSTDEDPHYLRYRLICEIEDQTGRPLFGNQKKVEIPPGIITISEASYGYRSPKKIKRDTFEDVEHLFNQIADLLRGFKKNDRNLIIFVLSLICLKRLIDINHFNKKLDEDIRRMWNENCDKSFHSDINNKIDDFEKLILTMSRMSSPLQKIFESIRVDIDSRDALVIQNLFMTLDFVKLSIENFGIQVFGQAFNNFVNSYVSEKSSTTPSPIKRLMVELLGIQDEGSIFDPAAGVGGFFVEMLNFASSNQIEIDKLNFAAQEFSYYTYNLLIMNMLMNGIKTDEFYQGDSISNPGNVENNRLVQFDYIISDFPWNIRNRHDDELYQQDKYRRFIYGKPSKNDSNFAFIQHVVASLKWDGKAILLIPQSVLSIGGKNGIIRKSLIDADLIEAIIYLPYEKSENKSSAQVVLIINNEKDVDRRRKILFINIRDMVKNKSITPVDNQFILKCYQRFNEYNMYTRIIELDEIKNNNYSLNLDYTDFYSDLRRLHRIGKAKKLKEIVTFQRGTRTGSKKWLNEKYPYVNIKDLDQDIENMYLSTSRSQVGSKRSGGLVAANSILISLIGNNLKPMIYEPTIGINPSEAIILSNNIISLIPNSKMVNIEYLYYQLYSTDVQKQIQSLINGLVPRISINDLENIIIPLPTLSNQKKLIEEKKRSTFELESLRSNEHTKSDEIKRSISDAQTGTIRILAHNLIPHVTKARFALDTIENFIEKNNLLEELIQGSNNLNTDPELLGEIEEVSNYQTVKDVLKRMNQYLSHISDIIVKTKDAFKMTLDEERDFDFYNLAELFKVFKEQKEQECNGFYRIEVTCPSSIFAELSKPHFIDVLDNLVRNAEMHAFDKNNNDQIDNLIQFEVVEDKDLGQIFIKYKNNGKKFNITEEEFFQPLIKSQTSSGYGLGGYYIKTVIEQHNGKVQIIQKNKGMELKIAIPSISSAGIGGGHGL